MHILFNGTFWPQPLVGSGQYLHGLLRWLPRVAPSCRCTLLVPALLCRTRPPPPPPGVGVLLLHTPFDTHNHNLAKLWFEQVQVPQVARVLAAHRGQDERMLLHIPYFAPPLRSAVPVVTTIPDIIPLALPDYRGGPHVQAYMAMVRRAAHTSCHTITFSQHSRHDIVAHLGLAPQRVTATLLAAGDHYTPPPSRETAAQQVAERYGLHAPYIYYVGGLDIRKNIGTLVQAMARLREQGAAGGATLAIAGRPPGTNRRLFPDLDALIDRLGVGDMVRRIDVPHDDGPLLYQGCTLFAFPSRYEGFGLPPLEAMQCGAPVVCSTTSSLPEVVGDAALCVPPDDVAGWAEAFRRLLDNATLRDDLRQRGLARAAQFSWRRVAEETAQVYAAVGESI